MVLLPKPRQAVATDLLPAEIDNQIQNDLGPIYHYYRTVLTQLTSLLREKAMLGRLPSDGTATAGAWGPTRYTVCSLMYVNQDTALDSNAYTVTAIFHG